MEKYYTRPKTEIVGFYCFISDRPKKEERPERRRPRWLEGVLQEWRKYSHVPLFHQPHFV
jgi:hypothetical protein